MKLAVALWAVALWALALALTLPAQAADFEFCWIGANGYRMAGTMSVPDAALSKPTVTAQDVTAFTIQGQQNGLPLGGWSLDQRTPTTSWNLNFDTATSTFVTGGFSGSPTGQQWNANGAVNNCGTPGFGFNSGAGGQDVCVNDTYRIDSLIPAATPLRAHPAGTSPACFDVPLLGALDPSAQPRS